MDTTELILKTREELATLERDLRTKIRDLRFSLHTGQVKTVREIRHCKRDLARVLAAHNTKTTV